MSEHYNVQVNIQKVEKETVETARRRVTHDDINKSVRLVSSVAEAKVVADTEEDAFLKAYKVLAALGPNISEISEGVALQESYKILVETREELENARGLLRARDAELKRVNENAHTISNNYRNQGDELARTRRERQLLIEQLRNLGEEPEVL
jgi:hypothetical protein